MAAEIITLNVTPTGDMPVLHLAQYDTNRPFGIALKWGEDDYTLPEGITCELQMRKTDSKLVTITPTGSSENVLEFECIEQMCTCPGENIAQLALMDESDNIIHTLRFEIEVQRDVMQGGMSSASDIHNLETQIEEITQQIIGEDYYTKTEVDDLIDSIPTFDPTNYYDKSDVDGLLADKADVSDLPDMSNYYTKSETDTALSTKADAASTYNMTQVNNLLNLRLPIPQEQEVQNLPASVVTLANAGEDAPLSELTVAVAAGQSQAVITRCNSNIVNFPAYARSTASSLTIETTSDGAFHYYGQPSVAFCQLTTAFNVFIPAGVTITFCRDQAVAYQHYLSITYIDDSVEYIRILLNTTSVTATLSKAVKKIELVCLGLTVGADYDDIIKFWIVVGSSDSPYQKYNGMTKTITFGQTLALSGSLDCISGVLTLADESTIQCQGVEIDTLLHDNNIYSDTGDILSMKYIIAGSEDVFKYIRMIKG